MLTTCFYFLVYFATMTGDPLADIDTLIEQNPEQANKQLLVALEDPASEARANYLLCLLANRNGDQHQAAIDYGQKAAQLLPEDSQAQLQYAVALRNMFSKNPMFAMSNLQNYKDTLDKAIALDKHNFAAWNEKIGFLMNAPPIAGGSIDAAKETLAQLKEVDENQAMLMTAALHAKQGEHEQAIEIYRKLTASDPGNMQARMAMGYSMMNLNKHTEAASHFDAIFASDAHLPALYQAGRARVLGTFELETAVSRFDAYIGRGGSNQNMLSAAHWRKGLALEGLGRKEAALAAYRKALEINPENNSAREALAKLESSP